MAVGSELGTTNTVIAAAQAGRPTVTPNTGGLRKHRSAGLSPPRERLVSHQAGQALNPTAPLTA